MSAICTYPKVNQKSKPFSICIIFFSYSCSCACVCDENVLHLLSQLTSSMQYIFKLQSHYWIWNLQNQFMLQVQICVPWRSSPDPPPDGHLSSLIPTIIFSLLKIPHICETMQHMPSVSNLTHIMMFLSLSILLQMQGFLPFVAGNVPL